jgi:hypothetical protein
MIAMSQSSRPLEFDVGGSVQVKAFAAVGTSRGLQAAARAGISVHSVVQLGFGAEERGFLQSTNSGLTPAARLVKTSVSATANAEQQ